MSWTPSGDPVKDYDNYLNWERSGLADLERAGLSKPSLESQDPSQPAARAGSPRRRSREARPAIANATVAAIALFSLLGALSAGGPDWLFLTFCALVALSLLVGIVAAQWDKRR